MSLASSFSPSRGGGGGGGNSTPTSVITQMEEALARLDEYKVPEEFTTSKASHNSSSSTKKNVSSLIQRYEGLRKTYLDSQVTSSVLDHLVALDDDNVENWDRNLPRQHELPQEEEELAQKQEHMVQALHATAKRMVTAEEELLTEYDLLQERKMELQALLQEYVNKAEHSPDDALGVDDDNDDEEDDEMNQNIQHDLDEQERILTELQSRKRTLQGQLETLQVEALEMEQEQARLNTITTDDSELLQQETMDLQQQAQTLQRIRQDYDCRRDLLEELTGLQMESFVEEEDSNNDNHRLIHISVLMLRSHKLRVTVESSPQGQGRIVDAKFVDSNQQQNGGLFLPPLDDLLPTAQDPAGLAVHATMSRETAGFRFLLHQALARLETFQDRQQELELLRQICTSVQLPAQSSDPEQHLFQPVLCVWDWKTAPSKKETQVTAVLRLTPDCPALKGSVFLERLTCTPHVQSLARFVSQVQSRQHEYSSPTELVGHLQQVLVTGQWNQRPLEPTALLQNHYDSSLNGNVAQPQQEGEMENGTDGLWEC